MVNKKSTELTITTKKTMELVIDTIRQLPDGKWTVKIFPWVQDRTTAQNRLMWKWLGEIGEHFGWEADEAHEFFKEKFLLRIRYRDDPEFARMADVIAKMKRGDDKTFVRQWVIKEVSTTKFNAKQMAEYLNKMKRFAHENEANITIPPDRELKWLCGIK